MIVPILVETLDHPGRYTTEQLQRVRRVAKFLGRGRLVLCEPAGR
jgi:hypothetical protein